MTNGFIVSHTQQEGFREPQSTMGIGQARLCLLRLLGVGAEEVHKHSSVRAILCVTEAAAIQHQLVFVLLIVSRHHPNELRL